MLSNPMIMAGLVAVTLGGLAFVLSSGDSKAQKRQAALQKGGVKTKDNTIEKTARKKQISDSLKDLEKRRGQTRLSLDMKIQQAGLFISGRQFMIFSAISGLAVALLVFLATRSLYISGPAALIGLFGLPNLILARLRKRRINKFVAEFPNAIDIIVRGVKAGLPLGDCMRVIANEASEPVRGEFKMITETQAMGLSLGEAVDRIAQRVPVTETNFFAIVINIQSKAGGNLSEALGNLSRVLRERKKMKGKIGAMSMEAKASAAIIGAVPFVVVGLLYMSAPAYVSLLWTTNHGIIVSCVALVWMGIGIAMMKKMISFDF
ncbi:type II secretion system F family protein [Methylocapsa sp. S129]|uniref:type II secretion system F family protein n=1 Tax=Methylocapsa sp. S129 TaxID=1641869 RepID=UPI001FEE2C52|nr:type II secretion system F family protein [Methylocapsa sp. S129]